MYVQSTAPRFFASLSFLLGLWLVQPALAREPLLVKYLGNNTSINEDYYLAVITAALKATEPSHGPFKLMYAQEQISSERKHDLLILGDKINVDRLVGFPTLDGPRKGLIRVGTPILNGFMGYRILLIRTENQTRFSAIKTLDELRKLSMGFGKGWEGHVYKYNGFSVAEALTMPMLLKMLAGKRYYFVPLSAIEIDDTYEIDGVQVSSIAPEKSLLIYMPLPVYFYVSPSEPELADRLTLGLNYLKASGQMEKIFHEYFGERLKRLNLSSRRLIELENPDDDGSLGAPDHEQLKQFQ